MGSINRLLIPISILILSITLYLFLEIKSIQKEQEYNALMLRTEKIAEALKALRKQYTSEVLQKVQNTNIKITRDYKHTKYDSTGGAIPLPAKLSMMIAEKLSNKNTKITLYSRYPFPWKKNRVLTPFQKNALEFFEVNKLSDKAYFKFDEKKQVLNYAIPDKMVDQTCVKCHNSHPDTPIKNWLLGDIRGAISISTPIEHNTLLETANYKIIGLFIFSFICVILIVSIVSLKNKNLIGAITDINTSIIQMRKGRTPNKIKPSSTGLVDVAKNINFLANRINRVSEFTDEIGKGNFKAEFMAYDKNDIMGNTLITMKNQLQKETEDSFKRNWDSIGKNKLADIIRKNAQNPKSELFQEIIDFIVEYINIQMAGMYVLNDLDETHPVLEIAACYAFNLAPNSSKKVEITGLIKEAYVEKKTVFINKIPDNKIEINSGLIKSKPNVLLLIPMMINQKVYGIIELASLYDIEPFKILFLENVGNTIAATISEINKNENTIRVLTETKMLTKSLENQKEKLQKAKIVIEEKNAEIETLRLEEKMHLEAEIQNQKILRDKLEKAFRVKDKSRLKTIDNLKNVILSMIVNEEVNEIQNSWNLNSDKHLSFEKNYLNKLKELNSQEGDDFENNFLQDKGKLITLITRFNSNLENINELINLIDFEENKIDTQKLNIHFETLNFCLQSLFENNWNTKMQISWSSVTPLLSNIIAQKSNS